MKLLLKNNFFKGISTLNVPAIEPMKIDLIEVEQEGATSAFNLKSSFRNAEIHGLSYSKVLRTSAKFKKFNMKAECFTQRMDFVGEYKMNGQILVLPIHGEGHANVSMHLLTTRHEIVGDYLKRDDGNTYINITTYKIKFKPKWVTFQFDNLFNGDKVLSGTMNKFMNDNWQLVFDGLISGYEINFGKKFKDVANALFHKVPFEVIFPQ
jgi:Haemolymph juvenile hormone binding protein (JHBP)